MAGVVLITAGVAHNNNLDSLITLIIVIIIVIIIVDVDVVLIEVS